MFETLARLYLVPERGMIASVLGCNDSSPHLYPSLHNYTSFPAGAGSIVGFLLPVGVSPPGKEVPRIPFFQQSFRQFCYPRLYGSSRLAFSWQQTLPACILTALVCPEGAHWSGRGEEVLHRISAWLGFVWDLFLKYYDDLTLLSLAASFEVKRHIGGPCIFRNHLFDYG